MATARSMVLNVGDSFGLHRFRVMKEASEESAVALLTTCQPSPSGAETGF